MRYCVFSDVHGNLEACEAFLGDCAKEKPDLYVCLGDIVGYGADPVACIAAVKGISPEVLIAGNHEWGVLGLLETEWFNEDAAVAIEWTKGVVKKDDLEYIKTFGIIHESGRCAFVHGSPEQPAKFRYVLDGKDADMAMKFSKTPLIFVGHSHVPGVYYFNKGAVRSAKSPKVSLDSGVKYLINAGSVGQPRDGDPRLSYAIYDDEERTVEIKRAPYDIGTAQAKILKAGLPSRLASRLAAGR